MRPLALHPTVAPSPPLPPRPHDVHGASSKEPSFVAVLNAFDPGDLRSNPLGHNGDDAGVREEPIANKGNSGKQRPSPNSSPSIESALAALNYRTPALSVEPGGDHPSAEGGGLASTRKTPAAARSLAPAPQEAAIAAAAANVGADPIEGALLQDLRIGDPALGVQSVQARTHLAPVTLSPARVEPHRAEAGARSPLPTTPAIGAPQSPDGDKPAVGNGYSALSSLQAPIASLAGAAGASATASPLAPPKPGDSVSLASRTQSGARPTIAPSSIVRAPAPSQPTAAPDSLSNSGPVPQTSGERLEDPARQRDATSEGAAASDATFAASQAALTTAAAAPASIPIDQLADFVAKQAGSLSAEMPPLTTPPLSTDAAPQVVKDLTIALDPADLGAISIKMRLVNGKLTVVIGAANPSTRQAIENDRQVIADRLDSSQQTLETLIVKSDGPAQPLSGGNDASDSNEAWRSPANGEPASRDRNAGAGSRFGRDGASNEAGEGLGPRGRSGDLIV